MSGRALATRTAEPGFYCDGHGLNLRVDPSGARQWVQRLVIRGRPRMLGLGGYPLVSLAEARNVAFTNRQRARAGGDPLAEKRHGQGVPTVEEAAAEVLAQQRPGWRNAKYGLDWPRSLRAYAFPRIGALPVSAVTTADVLAILTPIWHEKAQTAQRVRQRISAVMKWAIAMGYRPDNPAGDALGQALGRQQTVVQHMRALPHGAVADALATVRASQALITTKDAFELLVLTAARSGEVRLATWDEMDLDAAVWTIPAARMKAKRDHRVPLSSRALAILHDVQRLNDGTGLVFRSLRGKPLSSVTLPRLTKELGIAAVPHGFRSSFRDWAAERTNTPREVVEAALAHTVHNPTEAAYARSDLFERRRRLMDEWAAYLGGAPGPDDPSAASPTSAPSRRRTTRGGKGGAEPRSVIRHREQRVVTLCDQGWTQEAIAADLGISQAAVSKILRRVEERALRMLSTQVASFIVRRARHLEYLSREGRQAWEQSKQGRVRRRQTKASRADGTPVVTQHVVIDEQPDPRLLDQARKAEEALVDLYGPSVPTPATTPGRTDPRHREALPPLVQLSDDLLERAHAELTQPRDPQDDSQ